MDDYINGCYTRYGSRPMNKDEVQYTRKLKNGMWACYGYIDNIADGISIDVYRYPDMQEPVFYDHDYDLVGFDEDNPHLTQHQIKMLDRFLKKRLKEMGLAK